MFLLLFAILLHGCSGFAQPHVEKATVVDECGEPTTLVDVPAGYRRLFLVRHGEVINPGGDRPVYYGCQDVQLSNLGEKEAIAAASFLSSHNLQCVASSPLSRARFGAQEVLKRQTESDSADEMLCFEGFTELDRGAWCGKTKAEIGEEMMRRFDACDESATPPGGESYPTLVDRVINARDELLKRTDVGRASAVVSHLQVTRVMLSDALGLDVTQLAGLSIGTASITCIDYDSASGESVVRFQSYKPESGLEKSKDGAN
ncbi:hypothetical protein THAOC_27135 [Thalassiosira oceanica]|uniref:Uncharacterized protein n=1 Tax=Thalassiosira oceanica TaxID=159749 RepID=K0RMC9_THAOC|nr:hypothetical protein THAOC_27135 [Thalassiosira oceanica]|eukprot:EJK53434.1 hypothetical protein THAOC_27135 [Thalassiosira oceanica]